MSDKKLLIIGAWGYVGRKIFDEALRRGYKNYCYRSTMWDFRTKIPYKLIKEIKPDLVINTAGYTGKPNVDSCEVNKIECFDKNVILHINVSEMCAELGIPLVNVSSGCIYNEYEKVYSEEDKPNFTFDDKIHSWYSGCKALAEKIIAQKGYPCWTARLRIPFDSEHNPRNYLTKLLTYKTLLDLPNSISYIPEFVAALFDLYEKNIPMGIYNITNPYCIKTSDITCLMEKYRLKHNFEFFGSLDEFNKIVVAPRSNCHLDTTKAQSIGLKLSNSFEMVEKCVKNYQI